MFEIFCLRFPIASGHIFKIIDDQSLADCKGLSRTLRKFLDDEKFYWIRIIDTYKEYFEGFEEAWREILYQSPLYMVKQLAISVQ